MATQKSDTNAGDIEKQLKTIRDDVARLTRLIGQAGKDSVNEQTRNAMAEISELLESSKRYAGEKREQARKTAASVEDYINEKPLQSTIVALMVGMLIGTLWRR